ncbi:restriction endonuclease subunit S [Vibrio vulnificus]|uniref:restriction endonuclease subunit S n=1 Tax=Vibrio vulnificus TaxID=672 RepID=UPI0032F007B9
MAIENLITEHIDIWTSAVKTRSTSGRGSSKKLELYGVKKLRELILELAVRGKLVPQDPNDEPATVLLERTAQEKAQLLKEKKIKSAKVLPKLGNNEIPFDIPESWNWIRLGEIGYTQTGGTPKKANSEYFGSDVPFIKPADITELEVVYDNEGLSYEGANALGRLAPSGSVLMVCIGTIGKCQIIEQDCAFNQQINSVTPFLPVGSFIFNALRSSYFRRCAWELSSSTTIAILNKGKWESIPIPLPPIAEQHRIVAKVDELMALCDQLEQQTEASIEAHQVLVTTLLDTLTNSADADELMQNWARISEHFDTLFTTEESIDQLKQTILQLAVMGKLVPQDPSDEPAAKLLKRIAEEKAQLVKEKKIKKQKALPPIAEDEKPFELPNGWGFAHMQDLCELITDGTHQTPKYTDTGRPFISAQCVKPFRFMPENCRYVSEEHYQAYIKNRNPEFRDILLSRVGAGIGEAAMIDTDLEFAIYVSTGLLKPHKSSVMSEYLVLWLNSPLGRGFSERNTLGKGVSQGNLNLSLIRAFTVSLPPLQEQKRIIEQVNKLSDLCDLLKERLQSVQLTQLSLTDVIAEQVV